MSGNNSLSDQIQEILSLVSKVVNGQAFDLQIKHEEKENSVKSPQQETTGIKLETSYPQGYGIQH